MLGVITQKAHFLKWFYVNKLHEYNICFNLKKKLKSFIRTRRKIIIIIKKTNHPKKEGSPLRLRKSTVLVFGEVQQSDQVQSFREYVKPFILSVSLLKPKKIKDKMPIRHNKTPIRQIVQKRKLIPPVRVNPGFRPPIPKAPPNGSALPVPSRLALRQLQKAPRIASVFSN